ncbi:DUF4386 domain-containing protein [Sphingomonas canadensis]|uniref:DUF4386 domain-containing protein n=1 Tax=Sphingomonas canadensis TaxID=1219257 RepID=A0ABW3HD19_9SPHN|nr:DUF4386 domain-containing protein [Sphingomonas canadensis]MCW3837888.1 DUF4386 domain-containing protein [Sphingomonas canadensis]
MRIVTTARIAGLLYMIVVATGMFSLAYVPSQIMVDGDMAASIRNIAAQEALFRAGIAAGIVCYLAFLLLPVALHRLLEPAGPLAARLMLLFAVVSVSMALLNLGRRLDMLRAIEAGAAVPDVAAIAGAYSSGMMMVQIFWGLWLLPLGYLIVRAAPIPRLLGVLLILGCLGYLVRVAVFVLAPELGSAAWMQFVPLPAAAGEIGTALWLLIAGARPCAPLDHPAPSS